MQKVLLLSALALGTGAVLVMTMRSSKEHAAPAQATESGACVLAAHLPVGEEFEGELSGSYATLEGEVEKIAAHLHADKQHRVWQLIVSGKEIVSDQHVLYKPSKKVVEVRNFSFDAKTKSLTFAIFNGVTIIDNVKPADLLLCK